MGKAHVERLGWSAFDQMGRDREQDKHMTLFREEPFLTISELANKDKFTLDIDDYETNLH